MDSTEPLTRVMALHALEYCERLFYLEEVEEIRIADQAVYDGRRLHEEIPEYVEMASFTLQSDALGIKGKVDVVRAMGGDWIPFEYKKGRANLTREGKVRPWPSDELQVAAYTLLLEEHFDRQISEARVYYAQDHRTANVMINDALRNRVHAAVGRASHLRSSAERPPISTNERLCSRCSLAPVCLPEEERLIQSGKKEIPRYFPPDREGDILHVSTHGSTIRRSGDSLLIENRDGDKTNVAIHSIQSIAVHGHVQVTTQAIHRCLSEGISIHYLTGGGAYLGTVGNLAGGVQRRLRQYSALVNGDFCLHLAKILTKAKIDSQLRYILRLTREQDRDALQDQIGQMRQAARKSSAAKDLNELRGWEGVTGKAYFSSLGHLTRNDGVLSINGRNRRPPLDPANAILSFLYSLLYKDCLQAIIVVGLDPCLGFYHQPRSSAYPLALDLMELFRVSLVDMVVLGSLHRQQWDVSADFEFAGKQCWLSSFGRKKAIGLYERRKQDTWKHPVIGYSLSYDRAIELEVRLLEKEWAGAVGLFAQSRIR
ncbi:type I-MYXAN CRISPR-associated endonuclease Cas4/Cas1 [Ferroacidibacillus organovorans]|nr:type I-MYXAN CRISPR-associated endonuclease Cas1 [Ferroacidibacillus organovorans]